MPLQGTSSALHFSGDYTQVVNFLESVERLAQPLGLSDKVMIKYTLKYTAAPQRQLLSYFEGDNYVEFTDYVLDFYLECRINHYMRPIIAKPATHEAPLEVPLVSAHQEQERALVQPEHALEQHEIAPIVHLSTPPETKAPITCAHQESNHEPHHPSNAPIIPPSKICDSTALPEAPLEDIILPLVSDDPKHPSQFSTPIQELPMTSEAHNVMLLVVRDDLKHPAHQNVMAAVVSDDLKHQSHFSALILEPSAVSEVHYMMPSNQSMSLHYPLIADDSVLFAFFTYNNYHLPVKHPCIMPPIHKLDHASEDPEVL
ncbi:hypothetical protein BD769DRAFT_1681189 [Suillus cothurnatus]|nr:hypothetical protein BD769DRAFT_1681189 [Suillus cothurnatus]